MLPRLARMRLTQENSRAKRNWAEMVSSNCGKYLSRRLAPKCSHGSQECGSRRKTAGPSGPGPKWSPVIAGNTSLADWHQNAPTARKNAAHAGKQQGQADLGRNGLQ